LSNSEFTTALERLTDVQEDDPLKTGTEEDICVNPMNDGSPSPDGNKGSA